jgi:hypothetical protein
MAAARTMDSSDQLMSRSRCPQAGAAEPTTDIEAEPA